MVDKLADVRDAIVPPSGVRVTFLEQNNIINIAMNILKNLST